MSGASDLLHSSVNAIETTAWIDLARIARNEAGRKFAPMRNSKLEFQSADSWR